MNPRGLRTLVAEPAPCPGVTALARLSRTRPVYAQSMSAEPARSPPHRPERKVSIVWCTPSIADRRRLSSATSTATRRRPRFRSVVKTRGVVRSVVPYLGSRADLSHWPRRDLPPRGQLRLPRVALGCTPKPQVVANALPRYEIRWRGQREAS